MQNQIQVFQNEEFGKLEVLMLGGKPHFPAADCAKVLGYKNPHKALNDHCPHRTKCEVEVQTGVKADGRPALQRVKKMYIPEGDLYRLILRSKLPVASRFETFVCDEVLPAIRQHGAYITADTLERMRSDTAFADELLERLAAEQAKNKDLMDYVNTLQPKAYYCDVVLQSSYAMPVSVIAKDYGMSAFAFNKLLHELGVQYKVGGTWLLYKEYANCGYTVSKTYLVGDEEVSVHTCWTQKGKVFLYALLKWYGISPSMEIVFDEAA